MKLFKNFIFLPILLVLFYSCKTQSQVTIDNQPIYESENLVVYPISENAFVHVSYLKTQDFGNVACNGLILRNGKEVVILDTPTDNTSSKELIQLINQKMGCKINAVVPTHFHEDCLGGLSEFTSLGIHAYANYKTIEYAKAKQINLPIHPFNRQFDLKVGKKNVELDFLGEGHTKDNIVAYFPSEKILFGGCLVKELGASKGNLEDANVNTWSQSIQNVKNKFPKTKIVVPGHGKIGNTQLLDYTQQLFQTKN